MRSIALSLLLLAVSLRTTGAQTVAADYRVQDTFASSVGTIGPLVPLVDPGTNGVQFVDGNVNGNPQRVLEIAGTGPTIILESGVQTQTNPFISSSNFSIVLLASFNLNTMDVVATKIFDFKNLSSDAGLYVNAMGGTLAFIDGMGVLQAAPGGAALASLTYAQIVLTRSSATNLVSVYVNGSLAFSFTDSTGLAVLGDATMSGNSFLTLFKDDGAGLAGSLLTESTQGDIARLRLYDGVLSAQDVMNLDTTIVPEPATWLLVSLGVLLIAARFSRGRVTVLSKTRQ